MVSAKYMYYIAFLNGIIPVDYKIKGAIYVRDLCGGCRLSFFFFAKLCLMGECGMR